jgi:serine/threonine-protein kinase
VADPFLSQLQAALGDRVTIERELAPGGMSRVFVGRDRGLNRQVVVKVLSPEVSEVVSLARFRREIQLLATLQHPLVVPILETGESDGLAWYSMPFVQGQSLRQRIDEAGTAGLPIGEAIAILRDVSRALAFAHGRGVVHRDIKPANVLLSDGAASLSDFGIARAVSLATATGDTTLTGTGVSLGTPAYMAPEQAAADPSADHRVDLYALGVMAHEMLDGKVPFEGTVMEQFAAKLGSRRPELRRSDVPAALRDLVSACLAPDANDRPASAQVVADQLASLQTGTLAERFAPSRRVRQRALVLGLGVVVVGGVIAAASLRRDSGEINGASSATLMIDTLPPLEDARRTSLVPDSARVRIYAQTDADMVVAMKIARELMSGWRLTVDTVRGLGPFTSFPPFREELATAGVRFGIAPRVRTGAGATVAEALVIDLWHAPGHLDRGECAIRGDAVTGTSAASALDGAATDLAGRIHSMFLMSFDYGPLVRIHYFNHEQQRILACLGTAGRAVPSTALTAFRAGQVARDRGDRLGAIAHFTTVLSFDSTSQIAEDARRARAQLTPRSLAQRIADVDSINAPEAGADPARVALFQWQRARVAGDVRAELEAARSLRVLQSQPSCLWSALISSARPVEAAAVIDRELARIAPLYGPTPERMDSIRQHGERGDLRLALDTMAHQVRTGFLSVQRAHAHWLMEDDTGLVTSALGAMSRVGLSPIVRSGVVPYLLHGLIAARDTTAWRAAFSRFAPDPPLPRAELMAQSMKFAVARGDAALGRRLAEEIVRDFSPYLGQPDVPVALAITIATAHSALGRPKEARRLLETAEQSPDPEVVRIARIELLLTVARLEDERALADLTDWVQRDLAEWDPPVALLTMARLRALQGDLPAAWQQLQAYGARGLTRWHANPRLDPELSKLRDYGPAKGFFTSR